MVDVEESTGEAISKHLAVMELVDTQTERP
jgi:hypothetical protein